MNCRHCRAQLKTPFVDLGSAPPSNSYLVDADLKRAEVWYPLRVMVCSECWLVQTEDYAGADEIFKDDYAYFSSYSSTWLKHAEQYVTDVVARFQLDRSSMVVELAANDGYLLQYIGGRGISCVGVEPTAGPANSARAKGLEIVQDFFGLKLSKEMVARSMSADLVVANNVLAHVPDINDFLSGVAALLKASGVVTFEFQHLLNLVKESQFDTIYHEHYSYLSMTALERIMETNGLQMFDVEEIATHGGSLRLYAQRAGGAQVRNKTVDELLGRERMNGLGQASYYVGFQRRAEKTKNEFLRFLLEAKSEGRGVAAYGAAAKGSTLLNYAGVRPDLLPYVVDKNPAKCGKFLPGSRIPIVSDERLRRERPDYVVILPWNIQAEVMTQIEYVRSWGGRFVTAVPELRVV